MNLLEQIFGEQAGGEGEGASKPRPMREAQIATLREVFARYQIEKAFKPGQLVTPRKGHNIRGEGEPYIVLEVRSFDEALFPEGQEHVTSAFGARLDIRIATIFSGYQRATAVQAYWNESWQFEPYTGPGAVDAEGSADVR